ncbi:MAG: alcohol dehydrogenase [Glaciihabitans sp.]|nr:alcohol dehydrogenase [Glaciihabitans sp.]
MMPDRSPVVASAVASVVAPVLATEAAPGPGREIRLDPAPTAMVWLEQGRRHKTITVPTVTLAPGDVLVEIELATICGSDVHTTQGHRSAPTPLVLGHEQVGRVVAVGDGAKAVSGDALEPGQRIVWSLTFGCGACSLCVRGLPQKCVSVKKYGHEQLEAGWELSGGFASHIHLRAGTAIVPVSDSLSATVLAPVSCGTATAAAALDAATVIVPLAGSVVVVFGAGLIGLTATAMATDRGAHVIVVDPDRHRRSLATRFGAAETVDPTLPAGDSDSLSSALSRSTEAPLIAIEASGSPRAVAAAIDSVGVGGVVVLVGSVSPTEAVGLDPERTVRRLLTIRGVHNYAPRHLEEAARYIEARHAHYPFRELVGATVALGDLDEGMEAAAGGRSVRIGVSPLLSRVRP